MTNLTIFNIKEISSFLELGNLTNLLNAYMNNHTADFFITAVGYNNGFPRLFLIIFN